MLVDQHMWCREENFTVFMYALQLIVKTLNWTTKLPRPNQAHIYFFSFPWLALYMALVCLIHPWPMLEKMMETLSVSFLVAIKVVLRRSDT